MSGMLVLAVIIAVAVFIMLLLIKGKGGNAEYPYRKAGPLLSKAERSFYGALVKAIGEDGQVFSKVRVADVLVPQKGLERSIWQKAFNAISAKHFDFVVCDTTDMTVHVGVELDDASHNSMKAQKRDDFLNGACVSAGLPLLRVKASRGYVVADLRAEYLLITGKVEGLPVADMSVSETVHGPAPEAEGSVQAEPQPVVAPDDIQLDLAGAETPVCSKCGANMVLRTVNKGDNAGKQFWGCSAFPKCRNRLQIDSQ